MSNTFIIRASAAPLALICPQSVRRVPGEVRTSEFNVMASRGTAIHKGIETVVTRSSSTGVTDEIVLDACTLAGCADAESVEDVGKCLRAFLRYWWYNTPPLSEWFPYPVLEEALSEDWGDGDIALTATGHPDLTSISEAPGGGWRLSIVDWKTGRAAIDAARYRMQLAVGAWLKLGHWLRWNPREGDEDVREWTIMGCILDLRGGELHTIQWGSVQELSEEVTAFFKRLCTSDEYVTGPHCNHCLRHLECPAWAKQGAQLVRFYAPMAFGADGEAPIYNLRKISPSAARDVHNNIKAVSALVKHALDFLRGDLAMHGPLDIGDGKVLTLREESGGVEIDPLICAGLVEPLLGEKMLECFSVSKTRLITAVKAQAERGEKGKAAATLMRHLDEAGALTPKPMRNVMRVIDAPEPEAAGELEHKET